MKINRILSSTSLPTDEVGETGASVSQLTDPMAGRECRQFSVGRGVHNLLRASHRLGAVHVRTHVHVLRVCTEAVEGDRRRPLPSVPSRHTRRHSHIQVIKSYR